MKTQVVSIAPDGTISGLDHKAHGLDLRKLAGPVSIKRVSEILWDEDLQAWTIRFMQGQFAGKTARTGHLNVCHKNHSLAPSSSLTGPVLTFADYDLAVAAEVDMIQAAQKNDRAYLVID